ncbi:MAG: putative toxin-antitoxin system toxin component, PIN family [Tepidisphaeraceae bacterium]
MLQPSLRIVIDTNTLLRGLVSASSAAARIRRAAEQRVFIPLLSKPVLDEYRAVLLDEAIAKRFPEITPELVEVTIRRLRFIGDYSRQPNTRFRYERDESDQRFLELAIGLKATHILSSDKDLLSLPQSQTDAGRRFRQRLPDVEVMEAGDFLRKYGNALAIQ